MAVQNWADAIASIESAGSGGYSAVGPLTKKGNRAYGRYQVMDFNVGPWTEKYLGRRMTPQEFLNSPEAQDAVFEGEFGGYVNKYGSPQEAASVWFTGRPMAEGAGRRDILGTSGSGYVNKFNRALGQGGTQMQPRVSTQGSMGSAAPMQAEDQPKWKNPDLWANLAIAFNSMRMRPDAGLAQAMRSGIESRASQRKAAQQKSRTVDALRQIGADPKLIQLAEAGHGAEALKAAMQQPKERSGVEVGGKLVDPVTGQVIYEDTSTPSYDAKDVATARKEFTSLPQVKDFAQQTSAYGRILASAKDPSAAGDLALIFNYMKVLDPGSTVREGEFATAQNAGGVDQRVVSLYNSLINGERLSPAQRADFADRATRLYQNAEQQYSNIASQYSGFAEAAGLPVEQVIPDFGYSGQLYQTPLEFRRPPAPEGISEQDWKTAWDNMTDEQRGQFLNGGQ